MRELHWFRNRRSLIHVDQERTWYGIERTPEYFDSDLFDQVVRTPEQKLMKGVLEEALFTFESNFLLSSTRAKRLAQEVEDWILSRDFSYLYSFESICDHLGLNADYLRRKLKEKKLGLITSSVQPYRKMRAREVA